MIALRVLFVTPAYKPYLGGVERVLEQLGPRLKSVAGIKDVAVLTTFMDFNTYPPRSFSNLPAFEILDGLKIFRRTFWPRSLPFFYHVNAGLFGSVQDVVTEFQPDVIHFLFSEWFVANNWIQYRTKNLAHVFTLFYHPASGPRAIPVKWGIKRLCNQVELVHVVSRSATKVVVEQFGVPQEQVKLIPLGVNPIPRPISRDKRKNTSLTILSVGRLSPAKGQFDLLRIFANIFHTCEQDIKLILVGGDGGDLSRITAFVKQNELEKQVKITGFISQQELEQLYSKADIFCLLSRVESYGLVFLEAMGYGLPVLAYSLEPLKEVLGRGAVLVKTGDLQAAADGLRRLITDGEFRQTLSREAVAHFASHPTWDEVAISIANLYQLALERKTQFRKSVVRQGVN